METVFVSKSAGLLDTLYAALRYVIVIGGAIPLLMKLLGERDVVAILAYFRSEDGTALVTAIGALAAVAIGLFKTFRRGKLAADVASLPKVPQVQLK
jgi:hypothetical protein